MNFHHYIQNHGIEINCSTKCCQCLKCYKKGNVITHINEVPRRLTTILHKNNIITESKVTEIQLDNKTNSIQYSKPFERIKLKIGCDDGKKRRDFI